MDLALIAVRAPNVVLAIEDCAKAGVRGAVIFTAGFKELGPAGEEVQSRLLEVADKSHIAVIGPNCLGAGNCMTNLNATFFPHPVPLKGGDVAMVSQSGGVTGLMLYRAADSNIGVSKFASIGNRVNIDFHDMLRYLRNDEETRTICLFVEGTEHAREMYEEMASTTDEKRVLVFKVGKTPVARAAALSHTGSLAGRAELYSASVKQAGGLEVDSVEEMIDTAKVLSICKSLPRGRNVAIVTHTLGIALIAAQTLEEQGVSLPLPSSATVSRIQDMLKMPVDIPIANPVDLLAQGWANPDIFAQALLHVIEEEQYDAAMTVFSPNFKEDIGGGMPIQSVIDAANKSAKPVVSVLVSPDSRRPIGWEELEQNGVTPFSSPQRAARALSNVIELTERLKQ